MITIDGFPIDAALTETHTYEADVTSYPVESGATITDNVRPRPITLELECIVSDSPIGEIALHRFTRAQITEDRFPAGYVAHADAFERMVGIRDKGEPVTIESSLKVYQNMVMTSFVPTIDKSTGRALRFSVSFTQIIIVANLRSRVRVSSPAVPNSKTKTSGPAVVVVNRPDVEQRNITTLSGRAATWNDERGRYEYASDEASDGGQAVPARDLGDYTKYDNKQTPVPDGGLPDDPSELGPDGKPVNSTYYDYQDDSWKNTDGSAVTKQQTSAKRDPKTQDQVDTAEDEDSTPWWQPNGGLGQISPEGR